MDAGTLSWFMSILDYRESFLVLKGWALYDSSGLH